MKKLLHSYDGGGVLGIGPATFLKLAEYYLGMSWRRPDAVGGTSVGSIIAAAVANGMFFHEIEKAFAMCAPEIFREPDLMWRLDLSTPTYDGRGLRNSLRYVFGNTRMCDLRIPCFIVGMDYSRGKPKVFDITDGDMVADVVAMSCSAPTYFPPINGIVDGGLVANNPAMCLITGLMQKNGWSLDDMWLLSFGTNGDYWKDPHVDSRTGKLEWAKILLSTPTRGNEEMATFQTNALLGKRHMRIEPILGEDYKLDDLDIMYEYADIWRGLYSLRKEELWVWLKNYKDAK